MMWGYYKILSYTARSGYCLSFPSEKISYFPVRPLIPTWLELIFSFLRTMEKQIVSMFVVTIYIHWKEYSLVEEITWHRNVYINDSNIRNYFPTDIILSSILTTPSKVKLFGSISSSLHSSTISLNHLGRYLFNDC